VRRKWLHGLIEELHSIFLRDLGRLKDELLSFESEEAIWLARPATKNSAGHLTLHICGNLRHFVGAVIGHTGYQRQRENEFSGNKLSREELLLEIAQAEVDVTRGLEKMATSLLQQPYPLEVFGRPMTYSFFLLHLSGHLNYHLGQINYFRRIERG